MEKAQGLPITTVVLIAICIMVLVIIILFFLGGFGSGTNSVNTFQCQQMCQTINTLVAGNQICDPTGVGNINSFKSFCSGNCDKKVSCSLNTRKNNCGWDLDNAIVVVYPTPACIKCNGVPPNPVIASC